MLLGAAGLVAIVGGCGSMPPAHQLPRCDTTETLVCYGKEATRLENRERLEGVDFCHCERLTP